ncbi:uncharacterized protein [Syngnathus scovelli]|uniref:uncharacterized protein n=1 Tax=Syngnathus scovelli TaxID=161590 RepID=UPI0035CA4D78
MNCAESSTPTLGINKSKYSNSFRLARSTRTRVQQLLSKYKEQMLGDKDFEDRSSYLKDLPILSTDFNIWLQLSTGSLLFIQDWERLHAAFSDMQVYKSKLELKRKELEMEEKEKTVNNILTQSIKHIELDLRDLMSQVSSQVRCVSKMTCIKSSERQANFPTIRTPLNQSTTSKTLWEKRLEGYIILRDLDLYLTKLARDFILLGSKTK